MTDKKNMSAPSFLRGHLFVPNVFVYTFLIMPIETEAAGDLHVLATRRRQTKK